MSRFVLYLALCVGLYLPVSVAGQEFIRGDSNSDALTNLSDSVHIATYLYSDGPSPFPFDAGDANDNGLVELCDMVYILTFFYLGGPMPPAPFPVPGEDPTPGVTVPRLEPNIEIALETVIGFRGDVGLPIRMEQSNDQDVEAVEVAISFDTAGVTANLWDLSGSILGQANAEYIVNDISNAPGNGHAWLAAVIDWASSS